MLDVVLYVFVFVASLVWFFLRHQDQSKSGVPEAKGLPFVGLGLEINQNNIIDKLSDLAKLHGDVFLLKLFQQRILCLNSVDVIKELLAGDEYKRYTNDRSKFFFAEYVLGCESVGFVREGFSAIHNKMRKGFTKGLHLYGEGIEQFEQTVLTELNRLNNVLEGSSDGEINWVEILRRSLANIMSITISGELIADGDPDAELFWDYLDGFNYFLESTVNSRMISMPFLRFIPSEYKQRYDSVCAARDRITNRYFVKQKETFTPGQPRGMVDVLLDEQLHERSSGRAVLTFTDDRIRVMTLETLSTGIVSTWSALSSTLLCLVHHPEYQDRIYKELMDVIGDTRDPTLTDKRNCSLLEALELEVRRLMPVLPIFQRDLNKDIWYRGLKLPSKTMILGHSWNVHHDEKTWGDPWNFRPDRFLDDNGQLLPRDHPLRQNWIPFGMGRRACVGEPFARSRYFLYMATLLRKWRFTAIPGRSGSCDPRNKQYFDFAVAFKPKPFQCKVTKR